MNNQRFKVGDKAKVTLDSELSSWVGEIVTIKQVMTDGYPFDYFVEREIPEGVVDYNEAWYDDHQLEPIEDEVTHAQ